MTDVAPARPAATIVLYRADPAAQCGFRVFMVRRSMESRFMPGAYVFPGGAVDASDLDGGAGAALGVGPQEAEQRFRGQLDSRDALALLAAGLREMAEEAGLELSDARELIPFAHWVTPSSEPRRFDAWFLVAPLPLDGAPGHDDYEVHDSRWVDPAAAVAETGSGDMLLAPPTFHTLWDLSRFGSLESFLDDAARRDIPSVQPRMLTAEAGLTFLLPGDRDYAANASMPGPTRIILGAGGRWLLQECR